MTNSSGSRRRSSNRSAAARAATAHIVSVAAIVLCISGCSHKADEPLTTAGAIPNVALTPAQREHVRLFTVVATRYRRTVETNGVVDFDNERATSLLAPISGPVARLLVSPGDQVKKGKALAAVDSPDYAAAVSAYQKGLATAQTNRKLADLDKDLLEHNGVSQREAAQAETDATNAEADRDAALQALVGLNVSAQTIKDVQQGRPIPHPEGLIRSPIAGTVVERLITPGQLLEAGTTPTFTVADLSRVWVMAQIFGADLASVAVGDLAEVEADNGSGKFSGRVENIAGLVNPDTRAIAVRVVVDNPGRLLKKQMYVRVMIQARQETTGLLVPVASILRDDENLPFAYLAQPDGSFARQRVTVNSRVGDQYAISEGLKATDRIVVDGGIFVQFMQNQ
jgi:cobalt-zinc-cadmium efflux system membrane fusion protein